MEKEKCGLEKKEENVALIRDVSITNLINTEIQKEIMKRTVELRKAFQLAIILELGMQNQQQVQAHKRILIPIRVNAIQYPPTTHSSNSFLTNNFCRQGIRPTTLNRINCRAPWLPIHRD